MNQPAQEKANLYTFDAGYVETLLAEGNWNGCWDYLGSVIENLTPTSSVSAMMMGVQIQKDMEDERTKQYVNDFGGLLGELFLFLLTEESTTLSDISFEKLIYYHETLHNLFYIYNVYNTDEAVLKILGSHKKLPANQQKKLLLLLSLDTELDIIPLLSSVENKYRLSALVSYMSHRKIFRERIYNNKIRLLTLRKELERIHTNFECFRHSTNVFFLSSYLNIPDKHKIKDNINTGFRNQIMTLLRDQRRIKNMAVDQSQLVLNKELPTVLVFAELFSKNHAMYRCYGNRVKALEKEFNVVLVMPADRGDPALKDDFKNYITFNKVGELYKSFHDVKPDIVFMPSVGMRAYSIIAANIREAPIQIMSLGHPATSMSDKIDYVLGPSDLYDEAAFPKDTYIGDGPARSFIPLISKEKFFAPLPPNTGPKDSIRIAVVGTDIKVSYPFFRLLKEIVEQAHFKIHVSFMMGAGGMDSLYFEKYLEENFENYSYRGWQDYETYLESIKSVDIVMNPFPFGHTNTIIDTLMCGKPCIGLEGVEPAAKTEAHVLHGAGLKDQFVAKDEDDYKNKFFGIAEDILNGKTVFYDREEVYNHIFKPQSDEDYGKLVKWIYDNHARLKASKKKYIEMFEEV